MQYKRILPPVLVVCFVLAAAFCSGCGVSEEEKIANDIMLAKYRLPSEDRMEDDFEWVFNSRLSLLVQEHGSLDFVSEYIPDTAFEDDAARFIAEAKAADVPLLQYVTAYGVRLPYYHELNCNDPADPDYYLSYTQAENNSRAVVAYLAELWGIEPDGGESVKDAVVKYCMENSRIVIKPQDPEKLVARANRRFGVRSDLAQTLYIVGEDGYAAVYDRAVDGLYRRSELESALGARIFGETDHFTVSRFCSGENWDYLLSNNNGRLTVLKFTRWVKANSEDYDAFVAIYGVEPKIHP